jgi:hypothetical protein
MDKTLVMREMTQDEIEAQQEQWDREAAELEASMTPEARVIAERLGVLFDKVLEGRTL